MFQFNCENCGHETYLKVSVSVKTNIEEKRERKEKKEKDDKKEKKEQTEQTEKTVKTKLTKEEKQHKKQEMRELRSERKSRRRDKHNVTDTSRYEESTHPHEPSRQYSNIETNHRSDIYNVPNINLDKSPNLPVKILVKHKGFWITDPSGTHTTSQNSLCDNNSVMFTNDSLLYVYKLALRHFLLTKKVIEPTDIDNANLVPHMRVRKDKNDRFSKYDLVQNKNYIIREQDISIKNDFITIEVDIKKDLHSTLIFSKGIKHKIDLLKAFKTVLSILNAFPNLIDEYSKLPYFGEAAIKYWYYESNNYPFNVTPPFDYIAPEEKSETHDTLATTVAGSIVQE
jgi:hypothetical protein